MKEEGFPYDGFLSYSWSKDIQRRVTLLVDKAQEKGVKLWQDKKEVGHGAMFAQMGEGIRTSEFFLPIITEDYVSKVDGHRLDLNNGKVTENCQFEANMGMIHRGVLRTIPIVMEVAMQDKTKWGDILGGNLGDLLFVPCFTDDDVDKAVETLAWQMENAKKAKGVSRTFHIFSSINMKAMMVVPKDKASEYVEGTRLWIYDNMQSEWLDQKDWSQVFVLLGYAGVGKSVCMANICERGHLFEPALVYDMLSVKRESSALKRLSQSLGKGMSLSRKKRGFIVVACHFFKHDDSWLRSAKDCILSLAAQMCETIPHFSEYSIRHNKNTVVQNIDVKELFKHLIAEPLKFMQEDDVSPPKGTRAFVVLDALDECSADEREGLLDILQTSWWEFMPKWLGVCVSSRPEDYIPPKLKEYKPTILDTENKANLNDMRVYLEHKLGKYFVDNEHELKASVEIVLERSKGHFLYARFIEEELAGVKKLTLKEVQGAKHFPPKLDGYYKGYFKRLFEKVGKEKYQALLASMCVSREPLPVDVVSKLLELDDEDEVMDLFDEVSQLLVVNDTTIRFVHKSMADFLTDRKKCTEKALRVKEKDGNSAMAKYCRENYLDSAFAAKHLVYHVQNDDQTVISVLLCDLQKLHQLFVGLHVNHRTFVSDLNQYYHGKDSNAELVIRALEKSLNGLDNDPGELTSQLFGRIDDRNHPVLKTTLDLNYSYLRSVTPCLTNAEDPLRMTLNGHGGEVGAVAMNDEVVVSGSGDSTIKIWSRATGECLKTLEGHSGSPCSVAICDDVIVSGSSDIRVKVWSLKNGDCLKTLEGHSESACSVAICDDVIVSGSMDKTVKVWSLKSGECLKTLEGHSSYVRSVAICDDVIVSGSDDKTVKVWSLKSGECLKTLEGHSYGGISVAICDDVIVSGSYDKTVKVWSLKSGECLKTLEGHSGIVFSVAICDDVIVSGSYDETVKVWSLKSGECLKTFKGHSSYVTSVAICDDVIVSGSSDETVKVWSLKSGECLKTLEGHSDYVRSVAICDDPGLGPLIVSGSWDKTVKVWSLKSGECLKTLEGHSEKVHSVAICDDPGLGPSIVSGSSDKTVKVWSLNSGDCLKTLEGHSDYVYSVAISDDVTVSGSWDKTVKVWSLKSGECLKTLKGHSKEVFCVAICGDVIVSGSDDKTVKVWSLKSGECLKTLEGHSSTVYSVAICDDVIVSGSSDETVKVWSMKSGECLKTLEGHSDDVNSVAIFDEIILSKSRKETIRWSRSSLSRLEDEQVPNSNASLSRALWVVDGNRISHPEVEVGFTMDAENSTWEASSTRIACFDDRRVLNLLEIV